MVNKKNVKYLLNTPILRDVEVNETGGKILVDKVEEYKVAPRKDSEDFGSATFALYIFCFFVIYLSAYANCDKSGIFRNWGTNSKGVTHRAYNSCRESIGVGKDRSVTLSYMLLYCNRYISAPLILLSCVLMAVMFLKQSFGVSGENDWRIFCVVGPFILGFLLSVLIAFGPNEHDVVHFLTAGVIIIFGTLFCVVSYDLYNKVYIEPSTEDKEQYSNLGTFEDLKSITIATGVTAIIALAGAFGMLYLKKNKGSIKNFEIKVSITDRVLGLAELLNLILIGVYMLKVSRKPPLLVKNFCIASI